MPHYFCNKTTTVTLSHARRVLIIRNMLHIMPKNRANRHNHKVIHEFDGCHEARGGRAEETQSLTKSCNHVMYARERSV